jgi:hypothetical protein
VATVLLLKPTINQYLEEAANGMIEDAWEGRGVWADAVPLILGQQTQQQKTTKT